MDATAILAYFLEYLKLVLLLSLRQFIFLFALTRLLGWLIQLINRDLLKKRLAVAGWKGLSLVVRQAEHTGARSGPCRFRRALWQRTPHDIWKAEPRWNYSGERTGPFYSMAWKTVVSALRCFSTILSRILVPG